MTNQLNFFEYRNVHEYHPDDEWATPWKGKTNRSNDHVYRLCNINK